MSKEIFIVKNRVTLQSAISHFSEVAVTAIHFRTFLKKIRVVESFFSQITDLLFGVAIIYYNDSTMNVFLEIFQKFS